MYLVEYIRDLESCSSLWYNVRVTYGRVIMTITETRYAKALAKLEQAESDLTRAFNKWCKLRASVKRYERRLDKEVAGRHAQIGGKLDVREIASPRIPGWPELRRR
jgi:hypothetical protein